MSNILEQLSQLVQQAVTQAVKAGTLPKINPDDLKIEISKPNKNFGGDYSCGVALTLTRALKRPPMQIGEAIEAAFPEAPDVVEKIWLTPPGFINFKLAHSWLTNNLKLIRDQGSSYADQDFGGGERVMIEFVSVNPTGPLHVGHARGAILGSALANILTKTGHAVWCEYYVNDAGTQNRIFQEAMYNLINSQNRYNTNSSVEASSWFHDGKEKFTDYEKGVLEATEEIKKSPDEADSYFWRGVSYMNKPNPDYERALLDLNRALEKNPTESFIYYRFAILYMNRTPPDYDKAIVNLKNAIAYIPDKGDERYDYSDLYTNRGAAYLLKPNPDYDLAISDYTRAIELNPDDLLAYKGRATAYMRKSDPDYPKAISDFTVMLDHNPYDAALYLKRAEAYEENGETDRARDDQVKAKLYAESYTGEYMEAMKKTISEQHRDLWNMKRDEFMQKTEYMLAQWVVEDIKKTLDNLGVKYDQWFYEHKLMSEDGAWDRMFNELKQKGYIEERDGAQWFLATKFGAEKDVVVIRSGKRQEHTYFATDFAYHLDKLGPKPPHRNFSRTINIWGGDHHGHIIRFAAAMRSVDIDPARVQVQTVQIVHFKLDNKKLKLSKRKGQIVTIDDLLDQVGRDVCRYEFLNRSQNAQMTFDIEQAKRQSLENPVYYIQYAHARLCSILERAVVLEGWDRTAEFEMELLTHTTERALMLHLIEFPMVLRTAAERLEPHLVTFYLYELARHFQKFYEECRVISDNEELSDARLLLVHSTKTVLNEALRLLGISAPERMEWGKKVS